MAPVVGPAASRSRADKRKGKRNAERRCSVTAASRDAARALAARSPLGVPPRHLRQRPNATAQLEPRDFPGQTRSARPDGSKDRAHRNTRREASRTGLPCVTRGRYPRLTVPAQRDCTRSPVMMPSGRVLPKPPESRGDEPRPAGTALAPPDGVTQPASWYGGEIRHLVPHYVTICQVCVLCSATTRLLSRHPEGARQRVRPEVAGPRAGSARLGGRNHGAAVRASRLDAPRRAPQHDDSRNMPRTIATFRRALPCRVHTPDSTHS